MGEPSSLQKRKRGEGAIFQIIFLRIKRKIKYNSTGALHGKSSNGHLTDRGYCVAVIKASEQL